MNLEENALVKNAADPQQVKQAGGAQRRKREMELRDVANILESQSGRRFVWRYLEECGVFKTSFTGTSQTFYLEGQRNIGLKLLADVNDAAPDAYLVMLKENRGT